MKASIAFFKRSQSLLIDPKKEGKEKQAQSTKKEKNEMKRNTLKVSSWWKKAMMNIIWINRLIPDWLLGRTEPYNQIYGV